MQKGTVIHGAFGITVKVINWTNDESCPTFLGQYISCGETNLIGAFSNHLDKDLFWGWPTDISEPIKDDAILWASFTVTGSEKSLLNTWDEDENCYMDTDKIIYNKDLINPEDFKKKILSAFGEYSPVFATVKDL